MPKGKKRELFLGIDLGTSAVKVLALDEQGRLEGVASEPCPVMEPGPSRQEQDPEQVWKSMARALKKLTGKLPSKDFKAAAFSSAMHGFMAVDEKGSPLFPMLTWADGRAKPHADKLKEQLGSEDVYRATGCPLTALYYPARLLWLKEERPELFKRAKLFVSIKDFIFHRLTGEWAVDRSHASSNGLLNLKKLEWHEPLLDALGLSLHKLPRLVEPDEPGGRLLPEPARELGLPPGLIFAAGAGDGGLANLGAGAVNPGQAAITIGTSAAVRKVFNEPWTDPEARAWCYYLAEARWFGGGAMNSGGIVLRWLRDGLLSELKEAAAAKARDPYELITELAFRAPPGAAGLLFLPYLIGERTPHWNPRARGVLFGLSLRHGKAHLARAALEGVCMAVKQAFDILLDSPGGVKETRVTGGFTRSSGWVQLLADILGFPLTLSETGEGSALGAALLAMKAAGAISSIAQASDFAGAARVVQPDPEASSFYRGRFELWKELYPRLSDLFNKLADEEQAEQGGPGKNGHQGE